MPTPEEEGESAFSAFEDDAYPEAPPSAEERAPRRPSAREPEYLQYQEEGRREEPAVPKHVASSEVERRIEQAGYYNAVDALVLFEGDESPAAQKIRSDLHGWIVGQMERLLGIKNGPEPADGFTAAEIGFLKRLASRALSGHPPGPRQGEPAALPAPPLARRPAPRSATPRVPAEPVRKTPSSGLPPGIGPGEVFEQDGRRYKFVPNPRQPDAFVRLDVTRQAAPSGAVPMPQGAAMTMFSATQADRTLRVSTGNDPVLKMRIRAALNTPTV